MNPGKSWEHICRPSRPFHERATIHLLCGMLVVRSAEKADAVGPVDALPREPVLMIEFQAARFGAPAAALVR